MTTMTNLTPRFSIKWLILLIFFDFNEFLFLLIVNLNEKHLKVRIIPWFSTRNRYNFDRCKQPNHSIL